MRQFKVRLVVYHKKETLLSLVEFCPQLQVPLFVVIADGEERFIEQLSPTMANLKRFSLNHALDGQLRLTARS